MRRACNRLRPLEFSEKVFSVRDQWRHRHGQQIACTLRGRDDCQPKQSMQVASYLCSLYNSLLVNVGRRAWCSHGRSVAAMGKPKSDKKDAVKPSKAEKANGKVDKKQRKLVCSLRRAAVLVLPRAPGGLHSLCTVQNRVAQHLSVFAI